MFLSTNYLLTGGVAAGEALHAFYDGLLRTYTADRHVSLVNPVRETALKEIRSGPKKGTYSLKFDKNTSSLQLLRPPVCLALHHKQEPVSVSRVCLLLGSTSSTSNVDKI